MSIDIDFASRSLDPNAALNFIHYTLDDMEARSTVYAQADEALETLYLFCLATEVAIASRKPVRYVYDEWHLFVSKRYKVGSWHLFQWLEENWNRYPNIAGNRGARRTTLITTLRDFRVELRDRSDIL